jgi:pyruvate dehydrogenase E1 component
MTDDAERLEASEIEHENRDWAESLEHVHRRGGAERVRQILALLHERSRRLGVQAPFPAQTPYVNTIAPSEEPPYPGDRALERRIKSLVRWNAMAMVVRANRESDGIGGHISTYASAATLWEVGFNHFFRGPSRGFDGDVVFFQGHASPGVYARAFLEGRLLESHLSGFRREIARPDGIPSYPHPRLMPELWDFPTVSMGLSPIMAIYQARFQHYLEDRGLKETAGRKVWALLGDGELDEPESLGAITLASRERLDNLIFVVNCNLQRLDGPVRGNGKIIQELESAFRGAGWNVIKVIWGGDWDPLLAADDEGLLVERMTEVPDGQYQKYSVSGGDYIRRDFFGVDPKLARLVDDVPDEDLARLRRGGHDPVKVHAAYAAAVQSEGRPTVILAKTIKGYGLGEAGEGRNVTHQQKKLNEQELRHFRDRFEIPIDDDRLAEAPFYRPEPDSDEARYLRERREAMGKMPQGLVCAEPVGCPPSDLYDEFHAGTGERETATTMVAIHLLSRLLEDEELGRRVVPIVPDEARTFGMESLFRKHGIYSRPGQNYEPVDRENLLYYRESTDGQIIEEGITEAGSMCSFIAAGTACNTHRIQTVPFFFFYSMFGFQRIGDLVWASGDAEARGFMFGATSGRTTLPGEGLQHADGNSHAYAFAYPHVHAYDPAYAYEIAVLVEEGLRRMCRENRPEVFYLTVTNEFYAMPPMPEGVEEGIVRGLYRTAAADGEADVALMGSGAILGEVLKARDLLLDGYGVAADVWSVTSYKELYLDAMDTDRRNLRTGAHNPESPWVTRQLAGGPPVFVAATDYIESVPLSVARWIPGRYLTLGTDGFGRSDARANMRGFFEVDADHIALSALYGLVLEERVDPSVLLKALSQMDIDADKPNPINT